MPRRSKSEPPSAPLPGLPGPAVVKFQILAAMLLPVLLLGFWLQRQGFW
ncbi:MAG: hypothetical protein VKK98_04500 [Cyanobacteriota bacterium]|nr:hypothetical protein [Cyanobacteriota bacterium]